MKRRVLIGVFLAMASSVMAAGAFPVFAQTGIIPSECYDTGNYGWGGIMLLIGNIIRFALGLSGTIALVMFFVGGYLWIFGGAADWTIKKGKELMGNAVIGLLIVYGSWIGVNYFVASLAGQSLAKNSVATIFNGQAWNKFASNTSICIEIKRNKLGKATQPKIEAIATPLPSRGIQTSSSRDIPDAAVPDVNVFDTEDAARQACQPVRCPFEGTVAHVEENSEGKWECSCRQGTASGLTCPLGTYKTLGGNTSCNNVCPTDSFIGWDQQPPTKVLSTDGSEVIYCCGCALKTRQDCGNVGQSCCETAERKKVCADGLECKTNVGIESCLEKELDPAPTAVGICCFDHELKQPVRGVKQIASMEYSVTRTQCGNQAASDGGKKKNIVFCENQTFSTYCGTQVAATNMFGSNIGDKWKVTSEREQHCVSP